MENIHLENEYKMEHLSKENYNIVERLCDDCSDYYILHNGIFPSKEEIQEIFFALPPNKSYKDKFVIGIFKSNKLVGIIDIVKDFPDAYEWIIGLMLIEPQLRDKGLGKIVHKALISWAKNLGAKSFRIGVIKDNYKGFNFWSNLGYKKIKEVTMDFTAKTHTVNVMRLNFYK